MPKRKMAKLMMMAGGIVEPGGGRPGAVSAYVALSAVREPTRLFKVEGPTDAPRVSELPGATTVDIARFQADLCADLEPALREAESLGGSAAVATPKGDWVCGVVRAHLQDREGLVVG